MYVVEFTEEAQNYAEAQSCLGLFAALRKDYKNALYWYTLAAEQGFVNAIYAMGNLYDQ
ncbi:MAG: hypothetical protein J6P74_02345 [Paludibacteraceae bacterium]|nr:hypothetical protein [Paludibacteraceae bacterium]